MKHVNNHSKYSTIKREQINSTKELDQPPRS